MYYNEVFLEQLTKYRYATKHGGVAMSDDFLNDPGTVYHYCSYDTFKKIIEGHVIWLSDISRSNDFTEISLYIDAIKQQIVEMSVRAATSPILNAINVREVVSGYLSLLASKNANAYFALCTCIEPDLLSQWDRYAAHSTGVAIGFNARKLFELCSVFIEERPRDGSSLGGLFGRIHYVANAEFFRRDVVRHFPSEFPPIEPPYLAPITTEWVLNIVCNYAIHWLNQASWYKHNGFAEEQEFRFAMNRLRTWAKKPEDDFLQLHKNGEGESVFHYELHIGNCDGIIDEIILGPKCKQTPEHVQEYMNRHGYGILGSKVRTSTIPLA